VPALLAAATLDAAAAAAAGRAAAGLSANVLALAGGAMHTLTAAKAKLGILLVLAVSLLAGGGLLAYQGLGAAPRQDNPKPAVAAKDQAPGKTPPADDEALPAGALARLGTLRLRQDGPILSLAFSPDGKTLAAGRGVPAGSNGVILWDATSGKVLRKLEGDVANVRALAYSSDGKAVLSWGAVRRNDNTRPAVVQLADAATGKELLQITNDLAPNAGFALIAFSPDAKAFASGDAGVSRGKPKGFIRVWEAASGKKLAEWDTTSGPTALAFSPDRRLLAGAIPGPVGSKGRFVCLWDLETGKELRRMEGAEGIERTVRSLAFSPDGKVLAAPGPRNSLILWGAAIGKEIRRLEGHTGRVSTVAFSPDGKVLASVSAEDHTVRLWDPDSGTLQHDWKTDATALAFSPDGKVLALGTLGDGGGVGAVRLRDTATGQEVGPNAGHHAPLQSVACPGDGQVVATAGKDDAVRLWEASTGKEIHAFNADSVGVSGVVLSPDGKQLTALGQDGTVRVWDAATRKELRKFDAAAQGEVRQMTASPDGKLLIVVGPKGEVALWDLAAGKPLRSVRNDGGEVVAVAVSPGGRLLAAGSANGNIRVWDLATGKLRAWKKKRDAIRTVPPRALVFSPHGDYLVASQPNALRIFEVATGEVVDEIKAPPENSGALALSPDGRVLAVVSGKAVRLVDLATSDELAVLAGHESKVNAVAFSGDGKRLISVSSDTTGLVWDAGGLILPPQRRERSRRELIGIWDDLGDEDEAVAYRAVWALADSAPASEAPLREWLRPVAAPPDAKRFARLIADLDADDLATRTRAYEELLEVGAAAESAYRRALRAGPSLEARLQLEKLLARVDRMTLERLRQLRAILALARAGTPEARQLLRSLAGGEEGAWLTEEAKSALERLGRRAAATP
jgi:WD40 repeat protein